MNKCQQDDLKERQECAGGWGWGAGRRPGESRAVELGWGASGRSDSGGVGPWEASSEERWAWEVQRTWASLEARGGQIQGQGVSRKESGH